MECAKCAKLNQYQLYVEYCDNGVGTHSFIMPHGPLPAIRVPSTQTVHTQKSRWKIKTHAIINKIYK